MGKSSEVNNGATKCFGCRNVLVLCGCVCKAFYPGQFSVGQDITELAKNLNLFYFKKNIKKVVVKEGPVVLKKDRNNIGKRASICYLLTYTLTDGTSNEDYFSCEKLHSNPSNAKPTEGFVISSGLTGISF